MLLYRLPGLTGLALEGAYKLDPLKGATLENQDPGIDTRSPSGHKDVNSQKAIHIYMPLTVMSDH